MIRRGVAILVLTALSATTAPAMQVEHTSNETRDKLVFAGGAVAVVALTIPVWRHAHRPAVSVQPGQRVRVRGSAGITVDGLFMKSRSDSVWLTRGADTIVVDGANRVDALIGRERQYYDGFIVGIMAGSAVGAYRYFMSDSKPKKSDFVDVGGLDRMNDFANAGIIGAFAGELIGFAFTDERWDRGVLPSGGTRVTIAPSLGRRVGAMVSVRF